MTTFDIGDSVPLTWQILVAGLATNATVILSVVAPDQTVSTPTVSNPSTGSYAASVVPTQAGTYRFRWVATGAVTTAEDGEFDVRSTYGAVVSLTDTKAALNIPASDISHDSEIQGFIDAASATITFVTGPIAPKTYVEVRDGGNPIIMLDNPPVLSVTSVVEYLGQTAHSLTAQPPGSTADNYGYSLDDPISGKLVRRSSAGTPMAYMGGRGAVVITYVAGQAVSPDIRLAALEDIRGLYQQTQQGGRVGGGQIGAGGDDEWNAGPLRLFPRLAMLLDGPGRTQSIA